MKYHRDVYVLTADDNLTQVVRLESDSPISAFAALDKVSRELPSPKSGESRYLKVYCGEARR